MKVSCALFVVLAFASPAHLYCQGEKSTSVPRNKIREFQIFAGFNSAAPSFGTLQDFMALAPESKLLQNDLSNYSEFGSSNMTSTLLSAQLGLQFADKENADFRTNPLLRIGLSYIGGSYLSGAYSQMTRIPYDTLTSDQTGQVIYLDSIYRDTYSMNCYAEQIRLDGSLLFRTNPEARWHLFSGIGISAGVSVNARTTLDRVQTQQIESRFADGLSNYPVGRTAYNRYVEEQFKNKMQFGVASYIPLGVDFRIGNKKEFWKRAHLFYELRPMITYTSIPELGTDVSTSILNGVGFRVTWN